MTIDNGDPIDGASINDLASSIEKLRDKVVNLMWRNSKGGNDKTVRSSDGKRLQIIAGVVPVEDKTSKNDESSIQVKFYNAFGKGKDPTVIAMPESASPYGVSVKGVTREGFTLVIHQFPDNAKDDKLNLASVHYIAIGLP